MIAVDTMTPSFESTAATEANGLRAHSRRAAGGTALKAMPRSCDSYPYWRDVLLSGRASSPGRFTNDRQIRSILSATSRHELSASGA